MRLHGRHVMSGEEAVLITLRPYVDLSTQVDSHACAHACLPSQLPPSLSLRASSPNPVLQAAGSAAALTWELGLGRSEAAISATHAAVVEHIHTRFPHLIDSHSFSAFAPLFPRFAGAFVEAGRDSIAQSSR